MYGRPQQGDPNLAQSIRYLNDRLDRLEVASGGIGDAKVIENVSLVTGNNTIKHGLGRKPSSWWVASPRGAFPSGGGGGGGSIYPDIEPAQHVAMRTLCSAGTTAVNYTITGGIVSGRTYILVVHVEESSTSVTPSTSYGVPSWTTVMDYSYGGGRLQVFAGVATSNNTKVLLTPSTNSNDWPNSILLLGYEEGAITSTTASSVVTDTMGSSSRVDTLFDTTYKAFLDANAGDVVFTVPVSKNRVLPVSHNWNMLTGIMDTPYNISRYQHKFRRHYSSTLADTLTSSTSYVHNMSFDPTKFDSLRDSGKRVVGVFTLDSSPGVTISSISSSSVNWTFHKRVTNGAVTVEVWVAYYSITGSPPADVSKSITVNFSSAYTGDFTHNIVYVPGIDTLFDGPDTTTSTASTVESNDSALTSLSGAVAHAGQKCLFILAGSSFTSPPQVSGEYKAFGHGDPSPVAGHRSSIWAKDVESYGHPQTHWMDHGTDKVALMLIFKSEEDYLQRDNYADFYFSSLGIFSKVAQQDGPLRFTAYTSEQPLSKNYDTRPLCQFSLPTSLSAISGGGGGGTTPHGFREVSSDNQNIVIDSVGDVTIDLIVR